MDKRIMEIYIPLTISNREFSKFPVVFFLDALPAFYIYSQILFFKYLSFSKDFWIFKLSVLNLEVGGRLFLPSLFILGKIIRQAFLKASWN